MDIKAHAVISAGLGAAVWGATQSVPAAVTTLAVGVLMDGDHLVELYYWYAKEDRRGFYVLLHGWEYFAILVLLYSLVFTHPVLLGVLVGYGGHVIVDSLSNRIHPLGYFLTFRIVRRFDIQVMIRSKPTFSLENTYTRIPFGRYIVPPILRVAIALAQRGRVKEKR